MKHPFAIASAAAVALCLAAPVAHADADDWQPNRPRVQVDLGTPGYGPGYYGPSYSYQQPNYYSRSYGEDPAQFQARVEAMMNERVQRLEWRVQQGAMSPQALDDAREDRANVEQHIREAARDGVISRHEEREIMSMARGIGAPDHGYGPGPGYGYGGGPGPRDHDEWSPLNR